MLNTNIEINNKSDIKKSHKNIVLYSIITIFALAFITTIYLKFSQKDEANNIYTETTTENYIEIASVNQEAENAYMPLVNNNQYYPYCFYDIDKDGINELIMGKDERTGGAVDVYAYRNNETKLLGTVQTYGDAFKLGYIFEHQNGLGLVMKKEDRTEYGYWSIEGYGLKYNVITVLENNNGNIAYSVNGKVVSKEEYDVAINELAKDKITDYVEARATITTTTITTTITETTTAASVQKPKSNTSQSTTRKTNNTTTTPKNTTPSTGSSSSPSSSNNYNNSSSNSSSGNSSSSSSSTSSNSSNSSSGDSYVPDISQYGFAFY